MKSGFEGERRVERTTETSERGEGWRGEILEGSRAGATREGKESKCSRVAVMIEIRKN